MSSTVNGSAPPGTLALLLCDAAAADRNSLVRVSWNSVNPPSGWLSIPNLAEQRALAIRSEYFSWLEGLARHDIGGRSLENRLRWNDYGLSFWSMSLIAEKSPMKSAGIHAVFKLRALELLYLESACAGLEYHGEDHRLAGLLRNWMHALKHPFHFVPTATARAKPLRLPRVARAAGFLCRKLWREVRLTPKRPETLSCGANGQAPLNVFTYFPNIDPHAADKGQFRSRYWEGLHELFAETGRPINWIWIFSSEGDASYAQAVAHAARFNGSGPNRHLLAEQFASWRTVACAARRYLRLLVVGICMRPPTAAFRLPGSNIGFFPVLEADWYDSLLGSSAMANAWNSCLYDSISSRLPKAAATFYTWENQPWELALITSLREHGHSPVVGYQHALPAPLNLRYIPLPHTSLPDWLVVGGLGPRKIILEAGANPDRIVACEAVRYQYLAGLQNRSSAPDGRLLVITSLLARETWQQLTLLTTAFKRGGLSQFRNITIKPHPFLAIEPILEGLGVKHEFDITSQPLGELWASTRAAFVANSTAAAFDALYAGVPFVICSAGDAMNLNPLFMAAGIETVSTPATLEASLRATSQLATERNDLIIDPTLPRWRALLTGLGVMPIPVDGVTP